MLRYFFPPIAIGGSAAMTSKNAFPIAIGITKISISKCGTYHLATTKCKINANYTTNSKNIGSVFATNRKKERYILNNNIIFSQIRNAFKDGTKRKQGSMVDEPKSKYR